MTNFANFLDEIHLGEPRAIARAITIVEEQRSEASDILSGLKSEHLDNTLVLGITGPPGAGKSTLTNSLIRQLRLQDIRVGVVAIDPSSPISGGALLGDRIRMMDHALDRDVVLRSMATRGRLGGLCASVGSVVRIMAASGCRVVIIETVGTGQAEMDIVRLADLTILVLAPGFGDDIQAMKAGILEVADLLVINKADRPGAMKLMHDMAAWFQDEDSTEPKILQTVASEDKGVNTLLERLFSLEELSRNSGMFIQKRANALGVETVDWALEILRDKLLRCVKTMSDSQHDPRRAATQLVDDLLAGNKR